MFLPDELAGDGGEFVFRDGGDLLVLIQENGFLNRRGQNQEAHELIHAGRAQVEPASDLTYILGSFGVNEPLDLVGEDEVLPQLRFLLDAFLGCFDHRLFDVHFEAIILSVLRGDGQHPRHPVVIDDLHNVLEHVLLFWNSHVRPVGRDGILVAGDLLDAVEDLIVHDLCPDGSGGAGMVTAFQCADASVIAVLEPDLLLVGVIEEHGAVAVFTAKKLAQCPASLGAFLRLRCPAVGRDDRLHLVERFLGDDCFVDAVYNLALIAHLSFIDDVAQNPEDVRVFETQPSQRSPFGWSLFGQETLLVDDDSDSDAGALFQVEIEYFPDKHGLERVNDELVRFLVDVISQRRTASDEPAFPAGCGHFIPCAFADHLTLKLREGEENIER